MVQNKLEMRQRADSQILRVGWRKPKYVGLWNLYSRALIIGTERKALQMMGNEEFKERIWE